MKETCSNILRIAFTCLTLPAVAAPAYCGTTIETGGDVATAIVVAVAGGMPLLLHDREGMEQLLKSAALDLAVTYGLKYTVKERRPDGSDDHSFPSVHSSVAFTSAEYLRKRYGWEYGIPAYGLAAFVAYSRVEADKHYSRDVLAGAAIGMASSYLFTSTNLQLNLSAEAVPGYYGVRLTQTW